MVRYDDDWARESRHIPQHTPLKWRVPVPSHARERLLVKAFPRRSERDSSHWPAIHRPQRCPLPTGNGTSVPICEPNVVPETGLSYEDKQTGVTLPVASELANLTWPAIAPETKCAGREPGVSTKTYKKSHRSDPRYHGAKHPKLRPKATLTGAQHSVERPKLACELAH